MIFGHAVIHDGVFYLPGENVPISEPKKPVIENILESSESIIPTDQKPVVKRGRKKKSN